MKQISVLVIDPVGLHARPATVAVNAASKFKSEVKVAYKGRSVNMKSIMGVMSLGIPTQSEVTVTPVKAKTKKSQSQQSKKFCVHRK